MMSSVKLMKKLMMARLTMKEITNSRGIVNFLPFGLYSILMLQ